MDKTLVENVVKIIAETIKTNYNFQIINLPEIAEKVIEAVNSYKHSSDLVFKSGGRETFRLSGTGLLPDGTITPSVKLDIQPSQNLVTKDELDAGDRLLDKMFADDQTKTSGDND